MIYYIFIIRTCTLSILLPCYIHVSAAVHSCFPKVNYLNETYAVTTYANPRHA